MTGQAIGQVLVVWRRRRAKSVADHRCGTDARHAHRSDERASLSDGMGTGDRGPGHDRAADRERRVGQRARQPSDLGQHRQDLPRCPAVAARSRQWRARPRGGREPQLPAWMKRVDTFTPFKSAGMGALLSAVSPKNLLLVVGAAAAIAQTGASAVGQAVALIVFILLVRRRAGLGLKAGRLLPTAMPVSFAALVPNPRPRPGFPDRQIRAPAQRSSRWLTPGRSEKPVVSVVISVRSVARAVAAIWRSWAPRGSPALRVWASSEA